MPRTKYVRNHRTRGKNSTAAITLENAINEQIENDESNMRSMWLKQLEAEYEIELGKLDGVYNEALEQIDTVAFLIKSKLRPDMLKTTLAELKMKNCPLKVNALTSSSSISVLQILNNTKNSTLARSGKMNTSDEGYLTAMESRASSSDRARGRIAKKSHQKSRKSRSMSASKVKKHVTIHESAITKTPPKMDMSHHLVMGTVTPKLKPNLPLAVLRRPKQGETAISLQGSPLAVSGVITEVCANVNIPLQDGRIISLQPTRGIRPSQVPELDENTMNQLEALRDNLNKVVELYKVPL